jgi:hypothetical protein
MNNSKSILQKPNPNTGWANPEFIKPAFDQAVWDNGYEVSLERAVRCPCCKGGDALIDCQNCFGTGYFYVNAISTRALITGINVTNRYMRWSEELLGTIAITVIASDKNNLSWYDRITIHNEWSYYSEVLTVREIGSQRFVFTTYHPVDILGIYQYVSSVEPLKMVSSDNFIVSDKNGYCVLLGDNVDIQAELFQSENSQATDNGIGSVLCARLLAVVPDNPVKLSQYGRIIPNRVTQQD